MYNYMYIFIKYVGKQFYIGKIYLYMLFLCMYSKISSKKKMKERKWKDILKKEKFLMERKVVY